MEQEIIKLIGNYGVVGLLFYVAIKDFFNYLSKRKNGISKTDNQQAIDLAILKEKITIIEVNHIPHLEKRLDAIEQKIDKILLK